MEVRVQRGSPLSPLMLLLYIEILIREGSSHFGSTDDILILAVGNIKSKAIAVVQEENEKLVSLGNASMMDFYPTKLDILVVTRGLNKKLNSLGFPV